MICVNARQGDKTEFINFHLKTCKCPNGFPRSKKSNAAALSHWLRLIGHEPDSPMSIYKQDERVAAFDRYLNGVAGLSSATRLYRCRYEFKLKTVIKTLVVSPIVFALITGIGISHASELSLLEKLGEKLFRDARLSEGNQQACVSCHDPRAGWTNFASNESGSVVEGAIGGEFGNRKPPSSAYASLSPRIFVSISR